MLYHAQTLVYGRSELELERERLHFCRVCSPSLLPYTQNDCLSFAVHYFHDC
jgi:hypothetical protein